MLKLPNPVKVTLVSTPMLPCSQGYPVGASWLIAEPAVPEDMCASAWDIIHPWVMAIAYGTQHKLPHMKRPDEISVSCPDRRCRVVFKIEKAQAGGG